MQTEQVCDDVVPTLRGRRDITDIPRIDGDSHLLRARLGFLECIGRRVAHAKAAPARAVLLKIAAESRADVQDVVGLAHVLFDQVAFERVVQFSDRVHAFFRCGEIWRYHGFFMGTKSRLVFTGHDSCIVFSTPISPCARSGGYFQGGYQ